MTYDKSAYFYVLVRDLSVFDHGHLINWRFHGKESLLTGKHWPKTWAAANESAENETERKQNSLAFVEAIIASER